MRYVLGPSFALVPPAQPAAPSATGKQDPTITHKEVQGNVATFTVGPFDPATHNKLCEVRLYLVPDGHPDLPASADEYITPAAGKASFPFGHADTSAVPPAGGDVPITLPTVEPVAHHAQYVLGYDA